MAKCGAADDYLPPGVGRSGSVGSFYLTAGFEEIGMTADEFIRHR